MTTHPENTSVLRVSDLPMSSNTTFDIRPDAAARDDLSKMLGVVGLRKLRFTGTISPLGKIDWQLNATLGATILQTCVVTLVPVTTRIDVTIQRQFIADLEYPDDEDDEIEMPDDDRTESLGTEIDLNAILEESLALHLPLYPRAPDAALQSTVFTEPGKKAMTDEDTRPFAGLADLQAKLTDTDKK